MGETTFLQWCWDFFWNESNDGAKRAEEYILQLEHSRPERAAQARHLLTLLPAHFSHNKHAQRTLTDLARRLGSDATPQTKDRDYIDACRLIDAKETQQTMTRSPYDELLAAASVLAIAMPDVKMLGIARDLLIRDARKYRRMVVEHAATRKDLFDDLRFFADNRAPRGISDELYGQGAKTLLAFCTVTLGMTLDPSAAEASAQASKTAAQGNAPQVPAVPESKNAPSPLSFLLESLRGLIASIPGVSALMPVMMFWRQFNAPTLGQPPGAGNGFSKAFNRMILIQHEAITPHDLDHLSAYTLLCSYDRYDPHDEMSRKPEHFFPYRLDNCAAEQSPAAVQHVDAKHRLVMRRVQLHAAIARQYGKVVLPLLRVRSGVQFIPYAVTIISSAGRTAIEKAWVDDVGQFWFDPAPHMTLRAVDIEVLYAVWEDEYTSMLPLAGSMLQGTLMAGRDALLFPPRGVDSYAARCEVAFPPDIAAVMDSLRGKSMADIVYGLHAFFTKNFAYGSSVMSAWRIRNSPGRNDIERIANAHEGNCFDVNRLAFVILQKLGVPCRMRDGFGRANGDVDASVFNSTPAQYDRIPEGTAVQPHQLRTAFHRDESAMLSNAKHELHAFLEWFDTGARRWRIIDFTPSYHRDELLERHAMERAHERLGIASSNDRKDATAALFCGWRLIEHIWSYQAENFVVAFNTRLRRPRGLSGHFADANTTNDYRPADMTLVYNDIIDTADDDVMRVTFAKNLDAYIKVFTPFLGAVETTRGRVFAPLMDDISSGVYSLPPDRRRELMRDWKSPLDAVSKRLTDFIAQAVIGPTVPPLCLPTGSLPARLVQYDDQTFVMKTSRREYPRSDVLGTVAILDGLVFEWEREAVSVIGKLKGLGKIIPRLARAKRVKSMTADVRHVARLVVAGELVLDDPVAVDAVVSSLLEVDDVYRAADNDLVPPVTDPFLSKVKRFVDGAGDAVVKRRPDGTKYVEITTKDPITGKTSVTEMSRE